MTELPSQIGDNPYYRVGDNQLSQLMEATPKTRQAVAVDSAGNAALGVKPSQVGGAAPAPATPKASGSSTYSGVASGIGALGKAAGDYNSADAKAKTAAGESLYIKRQKPWEASLASIQAPHLGSKREYYA